MTSTPLTPAWVDAWLALPTLAQQRAALEAAGLFHAAGLEQLITLAAEWIRRAPGTSHQIIAICLTLAQTLQLPQLVARAQYLKAQAHALAGEFDAALPLVQAARTGYRALGQEKEALATNVGLMHILAELGDYAAAIAAGREVLSNAPPGPDMLLTVARVHHNQGLCYRRLGQYNLALAAYAAAETDYRQLNALERVGDVSNNRGVLLLELGRASEALAALETALAARQAADQPFLQAQSLNNLGSVQLLLGNYSRSLELFEQARQLLATQAPSLDEHLVLLDTAHAYLTLNLYPEAEAAYRQAVIALEAAGAVYHQALARWGLGATLLARGRATQAESELAGALALLPPSPLQTTILLELSAAATALGRPAAAQAAAEQALQLATEYHWEIPLLYAHLRLADLAPTTPQAEAHLIAAQPLVEALALPHLRYRWKQRLGQVRLRQGQVEAAQALLEAAIADMEQLRNTLPQESLRQSFLQDKVMAYDDLARLFLAQGDLRRALTVIEQAKSRALVDLMNGVATAQVTVQDQVRQQVQRLQADLNLLYNELLDADSQRAHKVHLVDTRTRVAQLEEELRLLQLRAVAAQGAGDPWTTTTAVPPTPPAGLTLISYYQLGDELLALVNGRGQLFAFRQLAQVTEVHHLLGRLQAQWGRFAMGEAFLTQHRPALERTARRILNALYELLWAPLEPVLADEAGVAVLPCGLLHHIPFHALFDGQQYLLERWEISYAPGAAVLAACYQRPVEAAGRTLILGAPDEGIPEVTSEVRAIAGLYPTAQVYLDDEATLGVLLNQAAGCARLHLACHGLFRADNPMFSALKLADGWLTAAQAIQLRLANAFVVLSACETGVSQALHGDELLGLLRAFLGAGAATVVVSLWLVQDQTTAQLMARLHQGLQQEGLSPAAALRQAQLALKATHPHPYYWAPFLVVGRR